MKDPTFPAEGEEKENASKRQRLAELIAEHKLTLCSSTRNSFQIR